MFFTIVIPSYNPRKYIPALLGAIRENYCYEKEIEIIFSDDCSTEPFEDLLESDYSDMNIRVIHNDKHYGFPRAGRQHGLDEAQGEWICFCDQDDTYIEGIFDQVRKIILQNKLHYYVVSNFYIIPEDKEKEKIEIKQPLNWTHGKFYERKFIRENNICYDSINYCEDINFSSKIDCCLHLLDKGITFIDLYTYNWNQRHDSLSRNNNYRDYFFTSFPDYIDGTVAIYIKSWEQNPKKIINDLKEYYKVRIIQTFLYFYFYFQGMMNPINDCPPLPDSYYKQIAGWFKRYKKCINQTTNEFLNDLYTNYVDQFAITRNTAIQQILFIEYESFIDWIEQRIIVWEDEV